SNPYRRGQGPPYAAPPSASCHRAVTSPRQDGSAIILASSRSCPLHINAPSGGRMSSSFLPARARVSRVLAAAAVLLAVLPSGASRADSTAQTLPFSQNWSNTGLITLDDNWSGVPGIVGYLGDSNTG